MIPPRVRLRLVNQMNSMINCPEGWQFRLLHLCITAQHSDEGLRRAKSN